MYKLSRLAALLVAGALVSAPALAADKGKAFVTVNGQAIPQAVYDTILAEQKAKGVKESPELTNAIKEQLIARELLLQEAKKKGFDKKQDIQLQIEAARQAVLVNAFLADYMKTHAISEAQLKAEYDLIKNSMGSTEYKSRHVLVDKEEDAKAIIAKLDKGEKFSELAKQSKDPGSKDNGGDLGWSSAAAYVKPFGDALGKLKKGEYTKTPVKSDFGYHVIQLDETRPLNPPPFEQIKPQLQQRAGQQKIDSLVKELRDKAKVN
ncbi:MAG: peptidylprolyl isomerase [Dechloromonas sp.]|jgi:peptidyl-prolyl cis-trans isomerase C|uniref:peptidylprolyl isomerase n=1 Tax=Azonexus sp. TaxID=1872668 RepID=UPI0035B1AB15|nr:peptidylprolyl isomerase [Dechloromonas sp.]